MFRTLGESKLKVEKFNHWALILHKYFLSDLLQKLHYKSGVKRPVCITPTSWTHNYYRR